MKKKESKEFDREREFTVILERIYSEVKTVSEGQDDLRSKFKMLFEEFGHQKEGIFIIKADTGVMKKDIGVMKKDIVEIKESVKSHEKRLSLLETSP